MFFIFGKNIYPLILDKKYWENKYLNDEAGWDIGSISTPLKEYFDQLENKGIRILIPGCGNAYEAEYLFDNGFKNVFVLDIAETIISEFTKRAPHFPVGNIIIEDFFEHKGKYDLIIEQTFFCAVFPSERKKYSEKVFELLNHGGKLVGLLFSHEFSNTFPPYGGTKEEYLEYFKPFFQIKYFSIAHNSIKPRARREFFINLIKI